jgi:hypothetical protein
MKFNFNYLFVCIYAFNIIFTDIIKELIEYNIEIIFKYTPKCLLIIYFITKKNKIKYFNYIFCFILTFNYFTTHGVIKSISLFDNNIEIIFIFISKYLIISYFTFILFDGLWWFYWFDENKLIKFIY